MNPEELLAIAKQARLGAYVPYSDFQVGAALLTSRGDVFSGCNVENISFGLTMCAERVAVGAAVCAGAKEFDLLAVISDSAEAVVPCGACRQVLAEFAPDLKIISSTLAGVTAEFRLSELLPSPKRGILG
jgi:cytidine deaminase